MKKILVTGVAGFIGSNFAHYIADKYEDYSIIGVDNLTPYSCRANIQSLEENDQLCLYVEDICDLKAMEEIYRKECVDYVINFAGESHNDRAILDPTGCARTNALGAQILLEASRRVGVQRHIHVSTIEVYGEQGQDTPFFTEASPLNAKTPYSVAKAAGDLFVRSYMQTYWDMDICMTHCANNYGPYQLPEKLIPLCIANVLGGKKAPLYGDGLQVRDWLHVYDHCYAIDLILHYPHKFEFGNSAAFHPEELPIFDISARQAVTNRYIVQLVLESLGKDPAEWIEYVGDRPNHDRKYLINPEKIERFLGFKPSVSFEDGIRGTVQWYVKNEDWLHGILSTAPTLQIDWDSIKIPGLSKQHKSTEEE